MHRYDSDSQGLRVQGLLQMNSFPTLCVCYFALLERGSELQKQIGGGKILGGSDGRNENYFESSLKKTSLLSKVIGFSSQEKDSYTSKF